MNIFTKTKTKFQNDLAKCDYNSLKIAVTTAVAAMSTMPNTIFASEAATKISAGISEMVGIATTLLMGAGIIWGIIAIFNWVSAIKEDDAARQTKQITNVIIAGLLILIKPIANAILRAMGADESMTSALTSK